jgi:hypothetical protein
VRLLTDRLWAKVDKNGPVPDYRPDLGQCWLFTGSAPHGYGRIKLTGERRNVHAHRVAYEAKVGPIPDGMVIDHLCRVKRCVNPAHLEVVTPGENVRRGIVGQINRARAWTQPACKRGHEWTDESTYVRPNGRRRCRICDTALRGRTEGAHDPKKVS